jgi:hypothetical protein
VQEAVEDLQLLVQATTDTVSLFCPDDDDAIDKHQVDVLVHPHCTVSIHPLVFVMHGRALLRY